MAERILYLVRHGQHDLANLDGDPLGGKLTPRGVEQAHLLTRHLLAIPLRVIHASSLRRTLETAQIVAKAFPDVPFHRTRILWECIPGLPEKPSAQFPPFSPQRLAEGKERAERVFQTYFKPARIDDKHELLVCHGNLIRYLVCRALGTPTAHWNRMEIANCSLSIVRVKSDGRCSLLSFNEQGHLPAPLRSFL
ncbi:MAG: hypothetical protein D6795_15235 [Deltaproteobacteria bacterium]|nr:MAG: hypothetical protein D6795_15235 [Deltaproteobacteria bacterium]